MMNRRDLASLLLAGLATVTLIGGPAAAAEPKTLKVSPHASLRVLDPITTNAYITRNHGYLVYDTLFSMDAGFRPQPQMVQSWTVSDDKLTYDFVLRDGLAFHDGAPVTAEDCVASLQRWAKRDLVGRRLAAATAEMKAVDPRTIRIVLKAPFGQMLQALSKPSSFVPFIMPKRIADTPPDQNITEIVGSGPFKFVAGEFQPGVKVVYERNTAYVPRSEAPSAMAGGKVAKVDRIEWISFPDMQASVNALKKGEIDLIENMTADVKATLDGAADVVIQKRSGKSAATIRFNWSQPPFSDVKVRKAVQLAVSQRDYMDAIIGDEDAYQICPSMFICGTPMESNAGVVGTVEADLAKAKAMLAQSSYKGERVVLITPNIVSFSGLAPLTQQVLRSIGINAEIQTMEWSTFLSRRTLEKPVAEGGWNLANAVFTTLDLYSPLANLNFDARGPGAYTGFVNDPKTEALKNTFAAESDPAKQKAIAEEMQTRAYDQVFYIPLGIYNNFAAYRSNVRNFIDSSIPVFWGIEKN
ncbi:ABC transporter substrate-binding protein [Allostella vacuolata]|nr:ABC transporter substrate-binding protein [Stella vacuolata]